MRAVATTVVGDAVGGAAVAIDAAAVTSGARTVTTGPPTVGPGSRLAPRLAPATVEPVASTAVVGGVVTLTGTGAVRIHSFAAPCDVGGRALVANAAAASESTAIVQAIAGWPLRFHAATPRAGATHHPSLG